MNNRIIVAGALALLLSCWAAPRLAAQYEEDDEESAPGIITPHGGSTLNGPGAGQGEADPVDPAGNTQQLVGGYLAKTASQLDPKAPFPCYDKMPTSFTLRGKGRLICWVAHMEAETATPETESGESGSKPKTTSRGGGPVGADNRTDNKTGDRPAVTSPGSHKNVHQWSDGSFPTGEWYENAKRAWRGASLKFADETGDRNILSQQITGYHAYVTKFFDPGVGAYMDNGAPSPVPDEAHWIIEISGGYKWEFDHGNSRDCIYSGNGITTLQGNGHSINLPAQQSGEFRYKGWPVCLRCDANVQGRVGGDDSTTTEPDTP